MSKEERPEILFQDESIVIVNKPAGLLSIPDRIDTGQPNLLTWLRKRYGEVFTLHRLDKDTSGLICFALQAEAHRNLSLQFEGREVGKWYYAFVDGVPPEAGEVDQPLLLNKQGKVVVHKRGKPSISKYRVIKAYRHFSKLEVELLTGRMHQIRVHLQHIGHPLMVDPVYGKRDCFYLSELKGKRYKLAQNEEAERPLVFRNTLHAHQLTFRHPVTGDKMNMQAAMPRDLQALEKQLGKWGGDPL